jgi:hypothetical protein
MLDRFLVVNISMMSARYLFASRAFRWIYKSEGAWVIVQTPSKPAHIPVLATRERKAEKTTSCHDSRQIGQSLSWLCVLCSFSIPPVDAMFAWSSIPRIPPPALPMPSHVVTSFAERKSLRRLSLLSIHCILVILPLTRTPFRTQMSVSHCTPKLSPVSEALLAGTSEKVDCRQAGRRRREISRRQSPRERASAEANGFLG